MNSPDEIWKVESSQFEADLAYLLSETALVVDAQKVSDRLIYKVGHEYVAVYNLSIGSGKVHMQVIDRLIKENTDETT